jgi:hypothetical protein
MLLLHLLKTPACTYVMSCQPIYCLTTNAHASAHGSAPKFAGSTSFPPPSSHQLPPSRLVMTG